MTIQVGSGSWIARGVHRESWPPLANGDQGTPLNAPTLPYKTLQVAGTFGTGGSVTIEGSNDGVNFSVMKDINGAALTFTAAGLSQVRDDSIYMRPRVTAGDGTTALNVIVVSTGFSA